MGAETNTAPRLRLHTGFTLVELLIVVGVIGVLAAITLVTFNGVQDRAKSAKIISQSRTYIQGLQQWFVSEGRPTTSSCIAPASAITGGICPSAFGWGSNQPYDAAFNAKLNTYADIDIMELGLYGGDSPKGLMWYHANYYSDNRAVLYYSVGPLSDCGLSNILSPNPGYDNMALMNAAYTARDSNKTVCMIEVFKY